MRLAASNIAWTAENDASVYQTLRSLGFTGLEIAPTRIFPNEPYTVEHYANAMMFRQKIEREYGLHVVSMQSIWYGRQEKLFGSPEERESLMEYTKRAIEFAEVLQCPNLVFGSPKNRVRGTADIQIAYEFFHALGDYAATHGTVLAIEPNPVIYETDFLTHTDEAIGFVEQINSKGLAVNLDVGTMVANGESVGVLAGKMKWIHHVHISEPFLNPIKEREVHSELSDTLWQARYEGWVSLEAKCYSKSEDLARGLTYIKDIFSNMTLNCT